MARLTMGTTYTLNSGHTIPVLGFGVYQTPSASAKRLVEHAVAAGYRHVDSAAVYRNEATSAAGLLSSGISRDELFFTSKTPPGPRGMTYEGVARQVDATLRTTKLDYIDLFLLHAPYGGRTRRLDSWAALVDKVRQGKIRSIGVSNYGVHHLEELEQWIKQKEKSEGTGSGGILSVVQVELHPWLARSDIVQWCRERGITVEVSSSSVVPRDFPSGR